MKGIDVWTSLLFGARISVGISFITVTLSTGVGILLGLLAGFYGKWFEKLLMRLIDVLMAFPGILLALTITTLMPPSFWTLILAISCTGWIGVTRLVRGEVLALKEREFVVAAKALGAHPITILTRHIFPQLMPIVVTHMALSYSAVIIVESSLSFLGLGPRSISPTWGQLLSEGRTVILQSPTLAIAPGVAIFLLVISLNLLGDAFRDHFDPKTHENNRTTVIEEGL